MPDRTSSKYAQAEAVADELIAAAREGTSITAMAAAHGLRREAIATVLTACGALPNTPAREALLTFVRDNPGVSVDDIATRLQLSKSSVSRYLRGSAERALVVTRKDAAVPAYSDDEMFEALRTAWEMLDAEQQAKGLSRVRYTRLTADLPVPAAATFMRRWRNWSVACEAAGIHAAKARRSNYEQVWTDEDILDAVNDFIDETGQITHDAYTAWASANRRPSGPLLIIRHRSWANARQKALALRQDSAAPASSPASSTKPDDQTYEVLSAHGALRFRGVQLGASTSYRPGAKRWIEFRLHRTEGGKYVLSRLGQTLVYHAPGCGVAARGSHAIVDRKELSADRDPCDDCRPDLATSSTIAVDAPRYWAQTLEAPEGVIAALHRTDQSGGTYLTSVAARLLDGAAEVDQAVHRVFRLTQVA